MFSRLTQYLTLIAFSVHAVVGCCAHHSHANETGCCQQNAAHQHGCDRDHEHDSAKSEHACAEDPGTITNDRIVAGDVKADQGDSPCDHEHSCNEPGCVYVNLSSMSFNLRVYATSDLFQVADGATFSSMPLVCTDSQKFWPARLRHSSSVQRCANQQSWQI